MVVSAQSDPGLALKGTLQLGRHAVSLPVLLQHVHHEVHQSDEAAVLAVHFDEQLRDFRIQIIRLDAHSPLHGTFELLGKHHARLLDDVALVIGQRVNHIRGFVFLEVKMSPVRFSKQRLLRFT